MEHKRKSRPESGLVSEVKAPKTLEVVPMVAKVRVEMRGKRFLARCRSGQEQFERVGRLSPEKMARTKVRTRTRP